MAYQFTAQWVKGCKNDAPDTLSHNPVCQSQTEGTLTKHVPQNHPEISKTEIRSITNTGPPTLRISHLCYHAAQDPEYQQLQKII